MLARLRRKFILINMAMVSVVVIGVLVGFGFVMWHQSVNTVNAALEQSLSMAIRNQDFTFTDQDSFGLFVRNPDQLLSGKKGEAVSEEGESRSDDGPRGGNPMMGPTLGAENATIPIAVYRVDSSYSYVLLTDAATAQLDASQLQEAMAVLVNQSEETGYLPSLGLFYEQRYSRGAQYVAFADASSAATIDDLLPLVGLGLLTLLLFFLVSVFFSKWALKPVEKAWNQQHQFVADASHELKTPITVILANMSILLKHPEASVGSRSQWVESTQREAEGMQLLVTDLLDLARTEDPDQVAVKESVDWSEATEGSLLQFESVAFERNVLMEEDVAEGVIVMGSPVQLDRLVGILLDNACKYAQPGSIIKVSLTRSSADFLKSSPHSCLKGVLPKGICALLSVSNQGEAIDPEDLSHIFDRFYRSDKARTRTEGSYGLGLAIAANTVELHQGAIAVQSTPEGATTFMVALPLHEN